MANALVVADDFTGAMDTGYGFAVDGRATRVQLTGPDRARNDESASNRSRTDRPDCDVLVIDANSRRADPDAAADAVSAAIESEPAPIVYKKVDSTLRGNVVPEVGAAIEATDADLAVVAPAFPSTGRVTAADVHLVDGVALSEAGYGAATSSLSARFDASRYRVLSLGIETVATGIDGVASALASARGETPAIVTCDAVHDRHLDAIAAGASSLDASVLFVGSGGLASALSVPGSGSGSTSSAPIANRSGATADDATGATGVLGVVGSVNERTIDQLAAVPDEFVYRLDPDVAVREPERIGREAVAALDDRLPTHGRAVVTAATEDADVERAVDAADAMEGDVDAGERIATALSTATAQLVRTDASSAGGLFVTGGSVARSVLDALNATAIDLTGEAVDDGVPEGVIVDGDAAGTRLVTKAGGFGESGCIVNCLSFLSTGHDHD